MTRPPGPICRRRYRRLAGRRSRAETRPEHLDQCPECRERARGRAGDRRACSAALPLMSPAAGVRRSGHGVGRGARSVRPPLAPATRRRLFATRRPPPSPPASLLVAGGLDGRQHRLEPRPPGDARRRSALARGAGRAGGVARRSAAWRPTSSSSPGTPRSGRLRPSRPPGRSPRRSPHWPIWVASSRCAASWLFRRSGWPMRASSRLLAALGCSLRSLLPSAAACAGVRPTPPEPARRAGPRLLGPRLRCVQPGRRSGRAPAARPRAAGHRARSRRRADGRPQRSQQAHRRRDPASASALRHNDGDHAGDRPRRHRAAGRLQHRLGREHAGPLLVVQGNADVYGKLHGNLVTVDGDVVRAPGRRGRGRHPHAGRRVRDDGRRDRRRGPRRSGHLLAPRRRAGGARRARRRRDASSGGAPASSASS